MHVRERRCEQWRFCEGKRVLGGFWERKREKIDVGLGGEGWLWR